MPTCRQEQQLTTGGAIRRGNHRYPRNTAIVLRASVATLVEPMELIPMAIQRNQCGCIGIQLIQHIQQDVETATETFAKIVSVYSKYSTYSIYSGLTTS